MHDTYTDDEREYWEERAAIAEYDGEYPRPIAESEATRALAYWRWRRGVVVARRWVGPAIGRE